MSSNWAEEGLESKECVQWLMLSLEEPLITLLGAKFPALLFREVSAWNGFGTTTEGVLKDEELGTGPTYDANGLRNREKALAVYLYQ